MNKIVVASANKGKIKEIGEILSDYEVVGYKDLIDIEIEETGSTFYENALIKAKTIAKKLNIPTLSDDSGLCVDALNGAPGVYSARYSGLGDNANIDKLLNALKDEKNRKAKFVSCVVMYYPNDKIVYAIGETEGEILYNRQGNNGFGYDSIFYSYDLKKSFGLATDKEKNSVSHRARAINKLKEKL